MGIQERHDLPQQNVQTREERIAQVHDQRALVEMLSRSARELNQPDLLKQAQDLARQYHAADHARLADDVYLSAAGEPASASLGYFRASEHPEMLRALGVQWDDAKIRDLLKPDNSDFRAEIYIPDPAVFGPDAKPVLSFKGSNGPVLALDEQKRPYLRESAGSDWVENGRQAQGLESDHYNRAMDVAAALKLSRIDFEIDGHSKGAGMGLAAAAVTNKPVFTFNAATLHPETAARYVRQHGGHVHDVNALSHGYYVEGEVLHDGIDLMHGMNKVQATQVTALLRQAGELSQIPEARQAIEQTLQASFPYDRKMQEGATELLDHLARHSRAGTLRQLPGHAGTDHLIALAPKSRNAEGELVDRPAIPNLHASSLAAAPLIAAANVTTRTGVAGKRMGDVVAAGGELAEQGLRRSGNATRTLWEISGNVAASSARNAGEITGAVVRYEGAALASARLAYGKIQAGSEELRATTKEWSNDLTQSLARSAARLPGLDGLNGWADTRQQEAEATIRRHRDNAVEATHNARSDAGLIRDASATLQTRLAHAGTTAGYRLHDTLTSSGGKIATAQDQTGAAVRAATAGAPALGAAAGLIVGAPALLSPTAIAGGMYAGKGATEATTRHGQAGSVLPSMDGLARQKEEAALELLQRARTQAEELPARQAPAPQALRMDDQRHPLFPLYRDCERGVSLLDAQVGRTPDLMSRQMAGAIASAMALAGGKHVDHVVFNRDASQVFGVQGAVSNPASLRVALPTMAAINTPLEQSSELANQHVLRQAMAQEQQNLQQEESRNRAMHMA